MTEPNREQSHNERLAEVLEALANMSAKPALSIEKIVAAVVMLIVTTVCLWVGTTLNATTRTVVELQLELKHMTKTVGEIKTELSSMRSTQASLSQENAKDVGLIIERMKADDERERRETATLADIDKRVSNLENKRGQP